MSLPSATMAGGASSDHARHASDFYETPSECVHALLLACPFPKNVWEPACGNGAISRVLEVWGHNVYSTDIRQTGYGNGGIDALKTFPAIIDAAITNPPFNQAVEFIEHLSSLRIPFALLLKATFWHAKSRHTLWEHTGPSAVMPLLWRPAMAPDRGKAPTMDFAWTVWDNSPSPFCLYRPLEKPGART